VDEMTEHCQLCKDPDRPRWLRPTYERYGEICTICFRSLWKEDFNFSPHKKCEPWTCTYCKIPVEPHDKDKLGLQMCKLCQERFSEAAELVLRTHHES